MAFTVQDTTLHHVPKPCQMHQTAQQQSVITYPFAYLQVDRQQCCVPVIGDEHRVVVTIDCTTTGHVPHTLQRSLAQQGAAELDLLALTPVDVLGPGVEAGVVHKHIIHTIKVGVEVAHLTNTAAERVSSRSAS